MLVVYLDFDGVVHQIGEPALSRSGLGYLI